MLFVFLTCGITYGQQLNKTAKKLDKLYQSRPEKCIKKCKRYIEKRKHKKEAYYYLSISYFKLYQTSKKERDVLKTMTYLRYFNRVKELDGLIVDTVLLGGIRVEFEALIDEKIKFDKMSIARRYAKKYKQVYKVDIPHFAKLSREQKQEDVIVKAPVAVRKEFALNSENLMNTAKSLLGTRYKLGGESRTGIDCSGFTKFVYNKEGVVIPHSAAAQSRLGSLVKLSKCRSGDLIFFGSKKVKGYKIQHTGLVYANEDGKLKIIHCPNSGVCVEGDGDVSWDMYWKKRLLFVKRLDKEDLLTLKTR
ncbi:MAG: hypothetical protein ACJA0Q_000741 [Saprospiraceae bacterium]